MNKIASVIVLASLACACSQAEDDNQDDTSQDELRRRTPQRDAAPAPEDHAAAFIREQNLRTPFFSCMGWTKNGQRFSYRDKLTFGREFKQSFTLRSPTSPGGKLGVSINTTRQSAVVAVEGAIALRAQLEIRLESADGAATFPMSVGVAGYNQAAFETSQGLPRPTPMLDTGATLDVLFFCSFDQSSTSESALTLSDM